MRAIVVGGGLVGSTLAAKLAADGHDVVLVERDRELLTTLSERLDVQTIAGNGATVTVLREAGIADCELLLATTDSDEANMVVALVGSALFGVPRVVARLRDPGHEESLRAIAAEMGGVRLAVNPDVAAVERILSLLTVPGAADVVPFFGGHLLVAGFPIAASSDFNGLLLSHLSLLFPATPMLVVAIRRDGAWLVPHGEDEIRAGDLIYFAMDPAELDNVLVLLGEPRRREGRVMVAGATRIGLELARRLEARGVQVTLLDRRRDACEEAAAQLDATLVVHGAATDRELLEAEGAERAAGFVACTDDHEENIVACLLARRVGVGHTFALVDNPALAGLMDVVGVDSVISPRLLSVGLALQFARRGRITAVATLMEETLEAVEAVAQEGSPLVRAPLRKLGLPRRVLVAALERHGRLLVPRGADRVEPGDKVLFITTTDTAHRLDPFLEAPS